MSVYEVMMSSTQAFLLSVLLFSFNVSALSVSSARVQGYYQGVEDSAQDQQLKNQLYKVLSAQHTNLGYDRAREFIFVEFYPVQQNGSFIVRDVYCEKEYKVPGPQQGFPEGNTINVEHTWPQSKFVGKDKAMQKADIHHLFPTDSVMNSDRANLPFGEVEVEKKPLKCRTARLGQTTSDKVTVFEPPKAHKGNVARALFYFSVRYQVAIDGKQEIILRKWDQDDPVDQEEIARNDEIFKLQKNRNPFIDQPGLAKQISDF